MWVQGVPTEREVHTADISGPVYRVLLTKVKSQITNSPAAYTQHQSSEADD